MPSIRQYNEPLQSVPEQGRRPYSIHRKTSGSMLICQIKEKPSGGLAHLTLEEMVDAIHHNNHKPLGVDRIISELINNNSIIKTKYRNWGYFTTYFTLKLRAREKGLLHVYLIDGPC